MSNEEKNDILEEIKRLKARIAELEGMLESEDDETEEDVYFVDNDAEWFVAEYDDKVVGQCSVGLVRRNARYRHRAEVAFVILQDYCNLGIGGKMMEECIKWCKKMV